MSKYLISNLSPDEFEQLGRDIFSKKFEIEFFKQPVGQDEGIDLINEEEKIIVQCKNIPNISNLFSKIKNEVIKVDKLNKANRISEYYIFTSASVTVSKRNEIKNLFCNVFPIDKIHIFDNGNIEEFISNRQNIDILRKNFKLWLSSSLLLELLHDNIKNVNSQILKIDIEDNNKFFVKTKKFDEAFKILQDYNIVLITGDPGVGKTSMSLGLLANLLLEDNEYTILYFCNNNMSEIMSYLEVDKKIIIYLDDFLGHTYLTVDINKLTPLEKLINLASRKNNLKIILNTRVTILNSALYKSNSFSNIINKKSKNIKINCSDISVSERASILFNHLYFNGVSKKLFNQLLVDNNYLKILNHVNYTPRIIENIGNLDNFQNGKNDFFNYCITKLDRAEELWSDEFKNYCESDLLYCEILYSISEDYICLDLVNNLYSKFKINKYIQYDNLETILQRLTKSILKIVIVGEESIKYVKFSNPSIIDYFNEFFKNNVDIRSIFLNNLEFVDQIERITKKPFFELSESETISINQQDITRLKSLNNNRIFKDVETNNILSLKKIIDLEVSAKLQNKYFKENIINLSINTQSFLLIADVYLSFKFERINIETKDIDRLLEILNVKWYFENDFLNINDSRDLEESLEIVEALLQEIPDVKENLFIGVFKENSKEFEEKLSLFIQSERESYISDIGNYSGSFFYGNEDSEYLDDVISSNSEYISEYNDHMRSKITETLQTCDCYLLEKINIDIEDLVYYYVEDLDKDEIVDIIDFSNNYSTYSSPKKEINEIEKANFIMHQRYDID